MPTMMFQNHRRRTSLAEYPLSVKEPNHTITVSRGGKGGKQKGAKLGRGKQVNRRKGTDSCHLSASSFSSNPQVCATEDIVVNEKKGHEHRRKGRKKTKTSSSGEHTLPIFRVSVLHGKFASCDPPVKYPPAVMKVKADQ